MTPIVCLPYLSDVGMSVSAFSCHLVVDWQRCSSLTPNTLRWWDESCRWEHWWDVMSQLLL